MVEEHLINEAKQIENMCCTSEYPPTNPIVLIRALNTCVKMGDFKKCPCIIAWITQLAGLGIEAMDKAIKKFNKGESIGSEIKRLKRVL